MKGASKPKWHLHYCGKSCHTPVSFVTVCLDFFFFFSTLAVIPDVYSLLRGTALHQKLCFSVNIGLMLATLAL